MKKAYIYLTCIAMAVLAVACSKNESLMAPDKKEAGQEAKIGFGSVMARASDAPEADPSEPLQIQVYDYFTPTGGSELKYIDEYIQKAESGDAWAFVKEGEANEYAWKKGTHKFFGWVFTDDGTTSLSGISYAEEDKVVTFSGSNVDYRYSDLVSVDWPNNTMIVTSDDDKKSVKPVDLDLHHLTAALKLKVTNKMTTEQTVAVTSVKLKNIVAASSATVDYSGTVADHEGKAVVTYSEEGTVGDFTLPAIPSTTLAADKDVVATAMAYVWPQLVNKVAASDETEGDGSETEPAVVATVEVAYTLGNVSQTTTMTLPATEWEAGKCYTLNLQIVNKGIELTFTVLPWAEAEIDDMDTEDNSINMSNVTWMNTKFDLDGDGNYGEYITHTEVGPDGKEKIIVDLDENTVQINAYRVMMFPTTGSFKHVMYETYEEDVVDEETDEVIHHAGDVKVYEEDVVNEETGDVIHHAGDPIVKKVEDVEFHYQPAQGYFTVNYPVSGLYKIGLIPAYGETTVNASLYKIMIYDSATQSWRDYNENGETITHDTIYFRVVAVEDKLDGNEQKAQIDIWFKPDGEDEWISAYSEIRANYALTIPANS